MVEEYTFHSKFQNGSKLVPTLFMRQFPVIFLLFCVLCGLSPAAKAARRPGVMRPVPLEAVPDAPNASALHGAWRVDPQSKKVTLIFTRELNGTRNLWQATGSEESEWPTRPLTRLAAPFWADEAQVSSDGHTILCVTNAIPDSKTPQIARLNTTTGQLEALTRDVVPLYSPALSPDGKFLLFVREVGKISSIYLLALNDKIAPFTPRRVTEGRHPAWLDKNTILFSDARKNGLYRLEIPTDWAPLQNLKSRPQGIALRSGEVAVVPDGSQLCIALDEERSGKPGHLFFMAPNGSGERALRNTEGARAPRFAPDGTALLFDAPLAPNGPRALWVMNLAPVVPTVEITRVSAEKTGLNIIGTVFCEDSPEVTVKLEAGQGATPEQWQPLSMAKAPLQKESLARWQPPETAKGDWTLRLTASSPDGDSAQTSMTISLPLQPGATVTNTSPDVSIFVSPVIGAAGVIGTHGIGSEVIPGEWVNGTFVPRGPKDFPEKHHTTVPNPGLSHSGSIKITPSNQSVLNVPPVAPTVPLPVPLPAPSSASPVTPLAPVIPPGTTARDDSSGGPLQTLPLPALPPPPSQTSAPHLTTPPVVSPPIVSPPVISPPVISPQQKGTANPLNLATPPVRHHTPPEMPVKVLGGPKLMPPSVPVRQTVVQPVPKLTKPKPMRASAKTTFKSTPPPSSEFKSDANSITLAFSGALRSGIDTNVTGQLRNTSKSVWSSSGDNPTRLLVRWFDGETGQRFRWEIKWLPRDVAPGESVPLMFTITPPRTGKLRLNFSVVRLPGGKYQSATADENDNIDKLAEKTLRVVVE